MENNKEYLNISYGNHPLENYTSISNDIILDICVEPIELKLFLYMTYCLKKNRNWKFNIWHLTTYLKVKSKQPVYRYLKNLEKEGWVTVRRTQGKRNTYILNHSKNIDTDKRYEKERTFALLTPQNFINTVQHRAYGYGFSVLATDINPLSNASEHIHFTINQKGEFTHFLGFELSKVQTDKIWLIVAHDRAEDVLDYIKQNRR